MLNRLMLPWSMLFFTAHAAYAITSFQHITVHVKCSCSPINTQASLSYSFSYRNDIRTLSSNRASAGRNIDGLLFTPSLPSDTCPEAASVIPANATQPNDLPRDTSIYWIAVAPWINRECTQAMLRAMRDSQTQAALFYLLDNSTSQPPPPNSPVWSLGDGGSWRTDNAFPVYAVASSMGQELMARMADYSGNLTDVPNGRVLAEQWPSTDYIRLAAEISVEGGSRLPSLWIFLLIVLGLLILIIGATSCSMHWVQRRRRAQLQRRVAAGEVDLEALGIKRLTVPQDVLDKMPLYTYTDDSVPQPAPAKPETTTSSVSSGSAAAVAHPHLHGDHFSQNTCPICLEDYTPNETTVRELPCRHLFHPECVDTFLKQNSSLCPMCKKSALPKGHCPAMVTNAMVRRERMVRLRREGRLAQEGNFSRPGSSSSNVDRVGMLDIARVRGAARRVFSPPERTRGTTSSQAATAAEEGVELRNTPAAPGAVEEVARPATAAATQPCPPSPETTATMPADRQRRREWARQRAVSMIGHREQSQDREIEAIAAQRPAWRRVVGRVFPGFA